MRPTIFFSLTDMSADFHNAMEEVTRRAKNKKGHFICFKKMLRKNILIFSKKTVALVCRVDFQRQVAVFLSQNCSKQQSSRLRAHELNYHSSMKPDGSGRFWHSG